ncbi:MAG: hypothetical protein ACPGU1_13635 [Myxococcota bacterium]
MTRRPKRRRRKHTAEEPLGVSGSVRQSVEKPPPRRLWLGPTRALIDALPFHQETRRGREFAIFARLMIGVAAIMMVTMGRKDWVWGAAGVLTALTSLIVPLSETRRLRWLRYLDAMKLPVKVVEPRPASLEFNGRKASIRVDGRVWRSVRPFDPPGTVRIVGTPHTVWLGLIPPEGRKRDELWFSTPLGPLGDRIATKEQSETAPDVSLELDADAFCAVYEAFVVRL